MIYPVKVLDILHRLFHGLRDAKEHEVLFVDISVPDEFGAHKMLPRDPVGRALRLEQHDGPWLRLAGLDEREHLEELVVGAEPAGKERGGVGLFYEDELSGKEIFIIDERCTNCSKCVWSCPIEVIKFNKNGVLLKSV